MPERQSFKRNVSSASCYGGLITFQVKPQSMFPKLKARLQQVNVAVVFLGGTLQFSGISIDRSHKGVPLDVVGETEARYQVKGPHRGEHLFIVTVGGSGSDRH